MNAPSLTRDARVNQEARRTASALLAPEPDRVWPFGALAVALILGIATLSLSGVAQAASTACDGVQLYPGDRLAEAAAAHPAGTTYCIHDGYYTINSPIQAEDRDVFQGLYDDNTRPGIKTSQASHIIHTLGADNVTVRGLRVSGAVHDDACEPECGRGIGGDGENLTVINVRATNNENQGVGGTGEGLRVIASELDHNGSFDAARDGGKVSAAGLKAVNSIYVAKSYVHDNYWNGVWCDIECGRFEVHDSRLVGNGKAGIHDEISTGPAVFEGNTIKNNGTLPSANRHTGLLIVSSRNVEAFNNTFKGNVQFGVQIVEEGRDPVVGNVSVHDNTMNGDPLAGCSIAGVSCLQNK